MDIKCKINFYDNNNININDMRILNRGHNIIKENMEKEINDYSSEYNLDMNEEENEKIYKIIDDLEKRINEGDKMIEYQNNEINKLINMLDNLNNQKNLSKKE